MPRRKKPTIEELEKMLDREEDEDIEILPNGEIRVRIGKTVNKKKVLTFRERLGGEYAA